MAKKKSDTDVLQSAGGLVWRSSLSGKELLIIHRPKYDDWSLPKGKLKPGETYQQAALREVYEETACHAEITGFAGCVCYTPQGIPKVVLYWNMKLTEQCHFEPNQEVDQVQWLNVEDALHVLDYPAERELAKKNLALASELA